MNTIDALENDICKQSSFISKFKPTNTIPVQDLPHVAFCGSGDSLAAAMLASSFSDYVVNSFDPLELLQNRNIAKGKSVYFVSVSGNTKANIMAAKNVKCSVAITKNPESPLAKACKSCMLLDYDDSGVLTSGSIGFVASALTCISMVMPIKLGSIGALLERAKNAAQIITVSGKAYFLGNQHTYPVSMYGAAKLYEVLGHVAHYERMEQFFHMGLFCARKSDTVIVFDESSHAKKSIRILRGLGLTVHCPASGTKNKVEQILFYTFVSQFLALGLARKNLQKECRFVLEEKFRNASSQMIY